MHVHVRIFCAWSMVHYFPSSVQVIGANAASPYLDLSVVFVFDRPFRFKAGFALASTPGRFFAFTLGPSEFSPVSCKSENSAWSRCTDALADCAISHVHAVLFFFFATVDEIGMCVSKHD